MCVLGVEGSEKICGPPEDNFWNSPNVPMDKQVDAWLHNNYRLENG